MKFIISSNPEMLAAAIAGLRSATVEAEYGDTCVPGSVMTMAHHGLRSQNPPPCSYPNGCLIEPIEVVGLSHIDLDAVGGCMALLNRKPEAPGFWNLAAFVDLNGSHKLGQSGASPEDLRRLYAFFAWSDKNKCYPPRDGTAEDVSVQVHAAMDAIELILADSEGMLLAGDAYKAAGEELNANSFVQFRNGVIVRVSPGFVNHLYTTPDGSTVAKAVVAYNTKHGSITVSFADKPQGKTAKGIVQELFGELAGGHDGIAGSPRGQRMTFDDLAVTLSLTARVA